MEFTLTGVEGDKLSLGSLAGKVIVMDFWATWCQPCRLLGPILEKLAVEYDGKFVLVKADTDKLPH